MLLYSGKMYNTCLLKISLWQEALHETCEFFMLFDLILVILAREVGLEYRLIMK